MGVSIINLLVPAGLGSTCSWVNIQLTSSTWWGFQYLPKTAQRYYCVYPFKGNQNPSQVCNIVSWLLLFLHPLSSLIINYLNLLVGTQGRSWRLDETHLLQTKTRGHRKAFVPQGPALCQGWVVFEGRKKGLLGCWQFPSIDLAGGCMGVYLEITIVQNAFVFYFPLDICSVAERETPSRAREWVLV